MDDSHTPPSPPAEPLTEKQRAFCREYLSDGNGRQAAIRAGYAVRGSAVEAARLLIKANVQAELARLRKQAESQAIASHDEVCRTLTCIIRTRLSQYVREDGSIDLGDLSSPGVQEVTREDTPTGTRTKIKLRCIKAAADLLSDLRGYRVPAKVQLGGRVQKVIRFVVPNKRTATPAVWEKTAEPAPAAPNAGAEARRD